LRLQNSSVSEMAKIIDPSVYYITCGKASTFQVQLVQQHFFTLVINYLVLSVISSTGAVSTSSVSLPSSHRQVTQSQTGKLR